MPDLAKAAQIGHAIEEILDVEYSDDRRTKLILAYARLSLDHHRAVLDLMKTESYGSALALVRPIFEGMLRAHWVARCADQGDIDRMCEKYDFDVSKKIDVDAIDAAFRADGFFRQAKRDAWGALNDFTHSGLRQLVSQFTGTQVKPNYKDEDLVQGLNTATASILLIAHLITKTTGREDKAKEVEGLFDFSKPA